jgi:hypothetical protein
MTFNVRADTKDVVDALDRRFPAALVQEQSRSLEEIADGILANIKRQRIFPKETKGTLKKGLWRDNPKPFKSGPKINLGWSGEGAAFGPGFEFGFRKPSWFVKPVGTREGKPINALRFVVGGTVVFSRGHTVRAPDKRPHFQPALEAYPVAARMGEAIDRAWDKVGP